MGRAPGAGPPAAGPALGAVLALVGLLVPLVLAALAPPAAGRTQQDTTTLQPSGFFEWNVRMDAGWNLTYDWSVREDGVAVTFDVHTHRGQRVDYLARRSAAASANGTVQAPDRGTYSLFWQADAEAGATVDWRAEGRFLAMDEHFADEGGEPTPGPGALAGAAALALAGWVLARRRRGPGEG